MIVTMLKKEGYVMRKMKIVLFILMILLVLTGCSQEEQEEQTFTEFLLEHGFECELGKCTESISYEGESHTAEEEEDWYTDVSNTSSMYHELQDKFVIDYVYSSEWDDGATYNLTIYISIYLSSGNVEVTSSSAYLSGDSLYSNDIEATATTALYSGGWSCTESDEDMKHCNDLKKSVDDWLEEFVIFYNIYENGE